MKRLYLAASIERTGPAIVKEIEDATKSLAKDLKVVFINTAAEGSFSADKTWLKNDREGLTRGGFNVFDYTITNKTIDQIEKDLGDCDVIHVNGGNSFYLLLQARKSGFDKWIKSEIDDGKKIYTGSSAGTQIIAPNIEVLSKDDTKVYEKELKTADGIGLVDFVVFPHWGSSSFEEMYFSIRLKKAYKPENKIILLNNWQYIKVEDDMLKIEEIQR